MPTFDFVGKSAVENCYQSLPGHCLEFLPELSLLPEGQAPCLDGNLIIEGDNLVALKSLLPTHAGKVKCVYIDPPYNTGSVDWVYNDNLTQPQFTAWIGETVGRESVGATRHDKWCCMMYPRLKLLRELLRNDGSMWVSIDDNEVLCLRAMMDEVFGPDCFVAQVTVLCNRKGRGLRSGFARSHDYLLVYSKRPDGCRFTAAKSDAQVRRQYPLADKRGPYRLLELRNTHRQFNRHTRPNLFFPLYVSPADGSVGLEDLGGDAAVEPNWSDGFAGCWTWGRHKVRDNPDDLIGRLVNGNWKVFRKSRPTPLKPQTVWHAKGFLTEKGQPLLTQILGTRVFHAPKPLDLLLEIIRFSTSEGDVVLDAFAGSGTTGHAVLAANVEAATPRRFVLIQQPFDGNGQRGERINICRAVTADRLRRVITGQWATGPRPPLGGAFTYAMLEEALRE
jgi:adenine-specific DNA-methyltransferase